MQIGVPKELKDQEYRVGLTPGSVQELIHRGHVVRVEQGAGLGAGFIDQAYQLAGAEVVATSDEIYAVSDLIVKVKEPQFEECQKLKTGQVLFAFLHLAPDPKQTELLINSGCVAIAYETVTDEQGGLPLLTPMSEVAGRMSIQEGAHYIEKAQGGNGLLLGAVSGVASSKVLILGGGVVGTQAVRVAVGMGADVTVLDKSLRRIRELDALFEGKINSCYATVEILEQYIATADLVIGAALVPGGVTPKLVSRELLKKMRSGSVIVDVSIDQGGCFETSRATTHTKPTYIEEGIIHYCVTNMPAGVPRTSTMALNNATLPFIMALADKGYQKACMEDPHLLQGLNVCQGHITHPAVALALQKTYTAPAPLLIKGAVC